MEGAMRAIFAPQVTGSLFKPLRSTFQVVLACSVCRCHRDRFLFVPLDSFWRRDDHPGLPPLKRVSNILVVVT